MMDLNSNNDTNGYYPITRVKDSNSHLSIPSQISSSSSIKLAIKKDERLEYLNILKGLIEFITNA